MNAFMAAIAGPAKISSPILPKPSVTRAIVEKSSQPQQAEGMLNVCCQDSRLLRLSSSPDSQSNMPPPLGGGASCAKATFENAKNVLIKSSRWKITRSEDGRVGKECVSQCRFRWSQ